MEIRKYKNSQCVYYKIVKRWWIFGWILEHPVMVPIRGSTHYTEFATEDFKEAVEIAEDVPKHWKFKFTLKRSSEYINSMEVKDIRTKYPQYFI